MVQQNMTQKDMVKYYLDKYGSITTWQAFEDLGILDLQGVIKVLRHKGMEIRDRRLYKRNKFGKRVTFKKYFIPKENVFQRLRDRWF